MAKLTIISGSQNGKVFDLTDSLVIGRNCRDGIRLPDRLASREHAKIFRREQEFWIEDLNSRNGTFVGSERISAPRLLKSGDNIVIGSHQFEFLEELSEYSVVVAPDGEDVKKSVFLSVKDVARELAPDKSHPPETKGVADKIYQRLQIIYNISQALGAIVNADELLEKIMKELFNVFPAVEHGFIMLRDSKTGAMIPRVLRNRRQDQSEKQVISKTIMKAAMEENVAVLSADALDDARFQNGQSIMQQGIRSLMCAPMMYREEALGLIHLDTSHIGAFDENDLNLLAGIAIQAAMKIKNMQLMEDVRAESELRANLSRYLSPDIVERAASGDLQFTLGGRLRHGTVLFSDIIGFTEMADKLPPEQVVMLLNRYFETMVEIVFRNGGMVDKFGGDSMLAVWGAWDDDPLQTIKAVNTALEMQNRLYAFNLLWEQSIIPVRMGIGLNSGPFVVGNIGSAAKMEFTVIGDSVNVAQRIESKALPGTVLTGRASVDEIAGRAAVFAMRSVPLKGKSVTVDLFSVRAVAPTGHTADGITLSIPCEVTGEKGTSIPALLCEAHSGEHEEIQLHFISSKLCSSDAEKVVIKPLLPEMPGLSSFSAQLHYQEIKNNLDEKLLVSLIFAVSELSKDIADVIMCNCLLPAKNPDAYKA